MITHQLIFMSHDCLYLIFLIFFLKGCPTCVWSSCSTQNTICMREISDGATRLRLFGHDEPVSSMAVLPTYGASEQNYQLWSSAADGKYILSIFSIIISFLLEPILSKLSSLSLSLILSLVHLEDFFLISF